MILAIVAIIVALIIYFTEKKIAASWKVKAENKNTKTETNLNIEALKHQNSKKIDRRFLKRTYQFQPVFN